MLGYTAPPQSPPTARFVYTAYFNLREPPFSISPDPAYLYMSARHQEALGHLLYGTGQYGGFVQLTGEVGTGKTTVVRTLLAQKLGDVDVAMIHNPRQSEQEFVASLCDELGVEYPVDASPKQLIDALNRHLLAVHSAGRRTVVIVDESQNLSPAVLEQVRLLTNLETNTEKLLRIMLIGQPELIELLNRPDLRQLASRITARYHLMPLERGEAREYIAHRLRVAGGSTDLFTPAAIDRVHRLARGIPRQINILCDRSLLGAYSQGLRQVTPEVVDRAAHEALASVPPPDSQASVLSRMPAGWLVSGAVIGLLLVAIILLLTRLQHDDTPIATASVAAVPVSAPAPDTTEIVVPSAPPRRGSDALADLRSASEPLATVMSQLIRRWTPDLQLPAGQNVCQALSNVRLECFRSSGAWADLEQIDRPAILTLNLGAGDPLYVLLTGIDGSDALLEGAQGTRRFKLDQLDSLWTGEYLLLWQHTIEPLAIGPQVRGSAVIWLRRQLALANGQSLAAHASERYDTALANQVRKFQSAHGLEPDGYVGIRTLIALAAVSPSPGTPTLAPPVAPVPDSSVPASASSSNTNSGAQP